MTMKHAEPSSDRLAEVEFERFYREAWPSAVRLAGLLTQHAGAAEDLAQEAFARMYPKWGRAEHPSA
jgi:RNA polymerase sigma factor (sigma-70 family)